MATTDYTTIENPCLCGKGIISVRRAEPDHMWARPSQTHYSAAIGYQSCQRGYDVRGAGSHQYPWIVRRDELEGWMQRNTY